jgi:hypothetical protein
MSPAGMEPLGSERHGQSPLGRSAGALRSIEPSCRPTTKLPTIWHIAECPRRESNPHLRFRKPPFYPLNYGDKSISDFRSRTADFKSGTLALALSKDSAANLRAGGALPAQNIL